MIGEAFEFLWDVGISFLSWEIDFGDMSFSLWQFAVASIVLTIGIVLVRGFFTRGD